jgi:hypothetical protein
MWFELRTFMCGNFPAAWGIGLEMWPLLLLEGKSSVGDKHTTNKIWLSVSFGHLNSV